MIGHLPAVPALGVFDNLVGIPELRIPR